MVFIGILATTTQVNIRMTEQMVTSASEYAKRHGFGNVQELIKESLREKLFEEPMITPEELMLVKKLVAQLTQEKHLWSTEEQLCKKLKR